LDSLARIQPTIGFPSEAPDKQQDQPSEAKAGAEGNLLVGPVHGVANFNGSAMTCKVMSAASMVFNSATFTQLHTGESRPSVAGLRPVI
jgi:hypothetical protein